MKHCSGLRHLKGVGVQWAEPLKFGRSSAGTTQWSDLTEADNVSKGAAGRTSACLAQGVQRLWLLSGRAGKLLHLL